MTLCMTPCLSIVSAMILGKSRRYQGNESNQKKSSKENLTFIHPITLSGYIIHPSRVQALNPSNLQPPNSPKTSPLHQGFTEIRNDVSTRGDHERSEAPQDAGQLLTWQCQCPVKGMFPPKMAEPLNSSRKWLMYQEIHVSSFCISRVLNS